MDGMKPDSVPQRQGMPAGKLSNRLCRVAAKHLLALRGAPYTGWQAERTSGERA